MPSPLPSQNRSHYWQESARVPCTNILTLAEHAKLRFAKLELRRKFMAISHRYRASRFVHVDGILIIHICVIATLEIPVSTIGRQRAERWAQIRI